jgi:hypothetical protein
MNIFLKALLILKIALKAASEFLFRLSFTVSSKFSEECRRLPEQLVESQTQATI